MDAMHLLGVLAKQGGQPEAAVQLISRAISRRGDVALFHYNLAEALGALERTSESIAEYERALELDPDHMPSHANLGSMLVRAGKFSRAVPVCRRALELRAGQSGNPEQPRQRSAGHRPTRQRRERVLSAPSPCSRITPKRSPISPWSFARKAICPEASFDSRKQSGFGRRYRTFHNNLGTALVHARSYRRSHSELPDRHWI